MEVGEIPGRRRHKRVVMDLRPGAFAVGKDPNHIIHPGYMVGSVGVVEVLLTLEEEVVVLPGGVVPTHGMPIQMEGQGLLILMGILVLLKQGFLPYHTQQMVKL